MLTAHTLVTDMSGNVRSLRAFELESYCGAPGCTEHLVDLCKANKTQFNKWKLLD